MLDPEGLRFAPALGFNYGATTVIVVDESDLAPHKPTKNTRHQSLDPFAT